MKHIYDTVNNQVNALVPGASVSVFFTGTTNLATIYRDNGVTVQANPMTTDSEGRFDFYVADGVYDIQASGPGIATATHRGVEVADVTQSNPADADWQTAIINFENQAASPPNPIAGQVSLFTKASDMHIYTRDATGSEFDLTGGGGGGGGAPGTPINSMQYNASGAFGGTVYSYSAADTLGDWCNTQPCAQIENLQDGAIGIISTDGLNFGGFAVQSDITPPINNSQSGTQMSMQSTVTKGFLAAPITGSASIGGTSTVGGNCYRTGAGSPPCALAVQAFFGDAPGDTANGQDAVGFGAYPAMQKFAGQSMNSLTGFLMNTPLNYNGDSSGIGGLPVTETANKLWGLEIQDLQGLGTAQTIGIHIEPQTNSNKITFDRAFTNTGTSLSASVTGSPSINGGSVILIESNGLNAHPPSAPAPGNWTLIDNPSGGSQSSFYTQYPSGGSITPVQTLGGTSDTWAQALLFFGSSTGALITNPQKQTFNSGAFGAGNFTAQFPLNTTAGSGILVALCATITTLPLAPTVTDTAGNVYTKLAQVTNPNGASVVVLWSPNVPVGRPVMTFNLNSGSVSGAAIVYEIAGIGNPNSYAIFVEPNGGPSYLQNVIASSITANSITAFSVTAPNIPQIVYSVLGPIRTTSSVAPVTMVTAGSAGNTYRFTGYLNQGALGSLCGVNTTSVGLQIVWTDPFGSTFHSTGVPLTSMVGTIGGAMVITGNGALDGTNNSSGTLTLRAKAGTTVAYNVIFNTGAGCNPAPGVQLLPVLEQLL